ncbi:class II fructose-bisphosphate aldolase [Bifidobacterium tissieri]|uniref:Fructose-bisphosphate aldolase n=2 Tax=Bifidobacterium tissieri TaxID=1630162 RepID=A0A5M9ZZH1_9BIFI|nr:class II fructose-bisphosphate aldolase [Bifidobacterium tissieri]KAA8833021.1 class II fructose-bisphosphate aldolase [Bifidobacterium tissieri]
MRMSLQTKPGKWDHGSWRGLMGIPRMNAFPTWFQKGTDMSETTGNTFTMTATEVKRLLDEAHNGGYAYPAINISNLDTAIAAMEGLEQANSAGFVQVSIGGAKQASPTGDPVEGSIIIGRMMRDLRKSHHVPIILHTDHCHADYVDTWLKPLLVELKKLKDAGEEKIFDSFMFDGSHDEIHDNAATIKELLPMVQAVDGVLEVEAGGKWGGMEDGVADQAVYSTPEDVAVIQKVFTDAGLDEDDYLLAVAFGNAHGTAVIPHLKPELLSEIAEKTGVRNMYVFHGGSGSSEEDVRAAVKDGVVKMNVDTDTQYEFTNGIDAFLVAADGKQRSHREGKKFFDPRKWNAAGRKAMTAKVVQVAQLLGSAGHATEVSYKSVLDPVVA